MKKTWSQSGNDYWLREISSDDPVLHPGIYKLNFDIQRGFYITRTADKFTFPYKIYGVQNKFVDRVKKTYAETTGNLGMLLNGIKGTGKSVTAEQICNELNLPIIIIHEAYEGIASYLNEIQNDVIIFVDEFEKIYHDRDYSILTIMDGVFNTGYRKVFILTTNQLYINDNLLQRPGRIRYLKTFGDLTVDVITEIVDDKLKYPEFKENCIKFISTLEIITIDIVKSVVDEVNIHNEPPQEFKTIFNVTSTNPKYDVYEMKGKNRKLIHTEVSLNNKLEAFSTGDFIEINHDKYLGIITSIKGSDMFEVDNNNHYDKNGQRKTIRLIYKFESVEKQHRSFSSYMI